MLSIVLAVILATIFTLIALANRAFVPVNIFGLSAVLPLYIIGGISFLIGIVVSLFFHFFDMISASSDLNTKNNELRNVVKTNQNLVNDIQNLRVENAHLKEKLNYTSSKLNGKRMEIAGQRATNFFDRVKHAIKGDQYSTPRSSHTY